MEIGERIKSIRSGWSRIEFAEKIGVNASTVQRWESGGVLPGGEALKAMHDLLGVNVDWLLSGERPTASLPAVSSSPEHDLRPEDYFLIGKAEGAASGGPGKVVFDNIVDRYPFKREFIHKVGGTTAEKRKHLYLVEVRGNSMLPTITEGELILVNCNEEQRSAIDNGGVYAVRNRQIDIEIKRLYAVTEEGRPRLLLVPDNRSLSQYAVDITPGMRLSELIIGRVVWVGKELV